MLLSKSGNFEEEYECINSESVEDIGKSKKINFSINQILKHNRPFSLSNGLGFQKNLTLIIEKERWFEKISHHHLLAVNE